MQYSSSSGLSALSPGNRDSMDPIAELLSQLSGVRRATNLGTSHSQLQQLQMQLQLERHSATSAGAAPNLSSRQPFGTDRAPIERVIRRHQQSSQSGHSVTGSSVMSTGQQQVPYVVLMEPSPSPSSLATSAAAVAGQINSLASGGLSINPLSGGQSIAHSRFLLSRYVLTNYSRYANNFNVI